MKKIFAGIIIIIVATLAVLGVEAFRLRHRPTPQPASKVAQIHETIIEGWNLNDIANDLNSNPKRTDAPHLATQQEFLTAAKNFSTADYSILTSKPAKQSLEGFLFPDTYFLPEPNASTSEPEILIKKALDNFSQKFTTPMQAQASADNMSVYQIVTLASIVEKETGQNAITDQQKQALSDERKTIASIFYNRLKIGMPLESDATVNYITGKNTAQASLQDTQIDNPYNTYKYAGLPPGPICNPSLSSILAALYPTQTDYLYFLHRQDTGQVIYSKTYEEHLQNKQKYLN